MFLRRSKFHPYLEALRISTKCPWLLSSSSAYSKLAPLQERKMVDKFRLCAKGGDGGNGCSSLHRSQHDRRGKPDGGNGGRGGDVILESSPAVWDFKNLHHHVNAKRGGNGLSKDKIGSRGADKVVQVPVGTVIHLVEGEVPLVVEDNSVKALDPWERPGTLEVDSSTLSDHRIKTDIQRRVDALDKKDFDGSIGVDMRIRKSVDTQKALRGSSAGYHAQSSHIGNEQFRVCGEKFVPYAEEGQSNGEGVESDSIMSDEELEENEEKNVEDIHYNVAELTEPGKRVIIAKGGEGGLGNVSLRRHSKVNKNMKDDSHMGIMSNIEVSDDEDHSSLSTGLPGSEATLVLELKSIADVGLVGMPNAGKSTLLGAISRAKPTVGHYVFTTLRPNIGNLNYDGFSVTVADIPGIIKGAHVNRGLGHAFLRHIERTKVLAFVVDLAAALNGRKGIPPWEQLRDLVLELECHQEGLSDRPSLIVANKIDEDGAEDVHEELKRRVQGVPIFPICAVLEEGVPELKAALRSLVDGGESARLELDRIMLD